MVTKTRKVKKKTMITYIYQRTQIKEQHREYVLRTGLSPLVTSAIIIAHIVAGTAIM